MIGGEDGSSPLQVKIFVNNESPDFGMIEEATATQVGISLIDYFYRKSCVRRILMVCWPTR